jgi:peptidyl-dipeptidase A
MRAAGETKSVGFSGWFVPSLSPPVNLNAKDGERFVRKLDARLEELDRTILVAEWNLQIGRSTRGSAPWQLKRAALLEDSRLLSWVRAARERGWPFLIRRRLELLERILLDIHVEQHPDVVRLRSDIQRRIVAFRPTWKGRKVNRAVVFRVGRVSPEESVRRMAYYAFEPLYRPLEDSLRQLIRIRNERARELGYRTFAEMRLGFQGLTPGGLETLSETSAELARGRLRALRDSLQNATGQYGWHPWDFAYARHRRAPLPDRLFPQRQMLPRVLKAIREWGFRTERVRFRVVFHDTPVGGLTLAPDPPTDVRILVHPQGGWLAYSIMFHEVGHAVHSASIRAPRHLLRWHENIPGFGAFHEGIGALFEDIPGNLQWLSSQPGVGTKRAEEFARLASDESLMDAAGHACWLRIEQDLYRRPERDPMTGVQRFERKVFGYDDYAPLSFVDTFFVEEPTYCSNYLLAILFRYQLTRKLRDLFGDPVWPNRHVGPWLTRNWFAPGSLYDWVPRVKEITGRPFGSGAFRAEMTAT